MLLKVYSIFFIPATASTTSDNPLSLLIFAHLAALYNLDPRPRWNLEHRLYRETATAVNSVSPLEKSKLPPTRYLQILNLSHHPGRSSAAITSMSQASGSGPKTSAEPAVVVSIPASLETEEFVRLISTRLVPLWTPRHALQVSNGQAYEVGDFIIRFGEVKQGQGGAQQIKGTIVELECFAGDVEDWETAELDIKAFWAQLDIKGAKEFIRVQGLDQGSSNARQWFEALRLR